MITTYANIFAALKGWSAPMLWAWYRDNCMVSADREAMDALLALAND